MARAYLERLKPINKADVSSEHSRTEAYQKYDPQLDVGESAPSIAEEMISNKHNHQNEDRADNSKVLGNLNECLHLGGRRFDGFAPIVYATIHLLFPTIFFVTPTIYLIIKHDDAATPVLLSQLVLTLLFACLYSTSKLLKSNAFLDRFYLVVEIIAYCLVFMGWLHLFMNSVLASEPHIFLFGYIILLVSVYLGAVPLGKYTSSLTYIILASRIESLIKRIRKQETELSFGSVIILYFGLFIAVLQVVILFFLDGKTFFQTFHGGLVWKYVHIFLPQH